MAKNIAYSVMVVLILAMQAAAAHSEDALPIKASRPYTTADRYL